MLPSDFFRHFSFPRGFYRLIKEALRLMIRTCRPLISSSANASHFHPTPCGIKDNTNSMELRLWLEHVTTMLEAAHLVQACSSSRTIHMNFSNSLGSKMECILNAFTYWVPEAMLTSTLIPWTSNLLMTLDNLSDSLRSQFHLMNLRMLLQRTIATQFNLNLSSDFSLTVSLSFITTLKSTKEATKLAKMNLSNFNIDYGNKCNNKCKI